ncbi:LysR family transcriptional regulator [Raoultella ornithinolytica]|jgi:DNA-binding transcriptional LysR family regulator|uniref:LysR family transcriptional regulator n=1 Tax=Raoultella ornithinolytica TaxID=54291 RepID=A0ABD7QPL2_RAOOR|nr:LysR family transcriptional regulator [Raoultella terrigena]ROS03828.1 DNA-binding transcriptional LysR family regulator [Raoultella terrigena]TCQ76679.1 LysR family transcriptional regulator [Raoultella ornithinolytica]
MQLKALRYFLMVASSGSFLATARHFGVPASSVSRDIAALEKELNQQLFYRSTRAVTVTEKGVFFLTQVREALDLLDNAAEQIAQDSQRISGKVRINAPEALGRLHIANLISRLQEKYPGVSVELTLTDTFSDPVQEGNDITFRVSTVDDSGMLGKVICGQNYIVAASQDYLAQYGIPSRPEDLSNHNCLLYRGGSGLQHWYYRESPKDQYNNIDVSGGISSNNAGALVAAAQKGAGIILFPTWIFNPELFESSSLIRLLPKWDMSAESVPTYIHALYPENKLRSHRTREILKFLVDEIGSPPYWDQYFQNS